MNTLKSKIQYRIRRKKDSVYIPNDFCDLSGYVQVLRALKQLVKDGLLVKLGYGVYAKTKDSAITPGKRVVVNTLPEAAKEALTKLNVKVSPSQYQQLYNQGKTTQVPTGRVIGVDKRVSRRLSYKGVSIKYELIVA